MGSTMGTNSAGVCSGGCPLKATANLITEAIEGYCTKTLGLPDGEAYALYKRHGTAIKGLILENILVCRKRPFCRARS